MITQILYLFIYCNILKDMQLNILQLYLNGLVKIFTFFELSTSLYELNHSL